MFVVAGVSGHTGAVVAQTLLDRRQPLRVIVRTAERGAPWKDRGADVAVASLDDAAGVSAALAGAQGAYFLIPPHYHAKDMVTAQGRVVNAIAAAVRTSRVPHVVFLSSIGAHLPSGTGPIVVLHEAEQKLRTAATSLSLVRAPYFMDNWLPVLGETAARGHLPSFLSPSRRIPMIASEDIGHIAAECLLDRPKGGRVLELSGPEDYSPRDVATALGRQLGRPVTVQHVPLSAVVPALTGVGFSADAARLFQEMYEGIEGGRIVFEDDGSCRPRGLVTLTEWVASHVPAAQPATT